MHVLAGSYYIIVITCAVYTALTDYSVADAIRNYIHYYENIFLIAPDRIFIAAAYGIGQAGQH